jgi:hypothetical protein
MTPVSVAQETEREAGQSQSVGHHDITSTILDRGADDIMHLTVCNNSHITFIRVLEDQKNSDVS